MRLEVKKPDQVVPEYSLTGDLISFMRCPMQYRFYNGSSLPPSRPVQMWYGEFIHGVLETAYRLWSEEQFEFPWPYKRISQDEPIAPYAELLARNDLRRFGWDVENVLLQQNKRARSRRARIAAYHRAAEAINLLGPHLFALVNSTEHTLIGTRNIPPFGSAHLRRSDNYVLTGVVDVLTSVELSAAGRDNVIREEIRRACPDLSGSYEVVVDYKGSHRPRVGESHWDQGAWQVQTYSWLREMQPGSAHVAAGILIYVNELSPGDREASRIQADLKVGDPALVIPQSGSSDWNQISNWQIGNRLDLTREFRYRRAIRVVPIKHSSTAEATTRFDDTVARIEANVAAESESESIAGTWKPRCDDWRTCVACDFHSFCPNPANRGKGDWDDTEEDPDEP